MSRQRCAKMISDDMQIPSVGRAGIQSYLSWMPQMPNITAASSMNVGYILNGWVN